MNNTQQELPVIDSVQQSMSLKVWHFLEDAHSCSFISSVVFIDAHLVHCVYQWPSFMNRFSSECQNALRPTETYHVHTLSYVLDKWQISMFPCDMFFVFEHENRGLLVSCLWSQSLIQCSNIKAESTFAVSAWYKFCLCIRCDSAKHTWIVHPIAKMKCALHRTIDQSVPELRRRYSELYQKYSFNWTSEISFV